MHQYDHTTGVTVRPTPLAAGAARWFSRGDALSGLKGSVVTADLLNDVMANILAVIAAGGITPTKGASGDQDLLNAIRAVAAEAVVKEYLIANPGYLWLQCGLLMQWGVASVAAGGTTVVLPRAFPHALWLALTSDNGNQCFATGWNSNGGSLNSLNLYARLHSGEYVAAGVVYLALGW